MTFTASGAEADTPFAGEAAAAAAWIVDRLAGSFSDEVDSAVFRAELRRGIDQSCARSGWSAGQPLLGSGTRAIVCDGHNRIDPIVAHAAAMAKLQGYEQSLQFWLFIDPGCVEVRNRNGAVLELFTSTPSPSSPKLRPVAPAFSPVWAQPTFHTQSGIVIC